MYKELFRVKYCNKHYLILSAPDHRKTFLEIKDSALLYPDINDFLKLHKIFNERNIIFSIRTHNYVEKVNTGNDTYKNVASLLLGLSIGVNIINPILFNTNKQYNNMNEDYETQYQYVISLYNNQIITKDDVIEAINDNPNFNNFQKDTALEVLDILLEKDSTVNLRIYYENVKSMTICPFDEDEKKDDTLKNVWAYYNSFENTIHMRNLYDRDTLKHELCHSIHHFLYKNNNQQVVLRDSFCGALEEAITNELVDIPELSYSFERRLLLFFWDASNNFTYHDYNEKGIKALSDELKKKYPNVDIDYLFDSYDTYHILLRNNDITCDKISKQKDILDETFKIVISNIDKDNIMDSFNSFVNVFEYDESIINTYFPQYLKVLLDNNYITQLQYNSLNRVLDIDSIAFVNDSFYVANKKELAYYDNEGNKNNYDDTFYLTVGKKNIITNLDIILKHNNFYDKDFIEEFINYLDLEASEFKNSTLDLIGNRDELLKIIDLMFSIKTSNVTDYSKLPEIVSNINKGFNNMCSLTLNQKYIDFLSKNNIISKDIIDFLNNAQGFTYDNGELVVINNFPNISPGVQVLPGKRLNPTVYVMHGNKLVFEDNKREKEQIDKPLIYVYSVNSVFKEAFIEALNPVLTLEENINNVLNRNNEIIIYDDNYDVSACFNLENSMVIEVGRSKTKYCYKITNNGQILSKNCDTFDSKTIKVPLVDFINIANDIIISNKLCLSSITIEEVLFYLKSIYPNINGTVSYEVDEDVHIGIDGTEERIVNSYPIIKSSIKILEPKYIQIDGISYQLNDLFIVRYNDSYYLRLDNNNIIELGTFDNVNNDFIYLESILEKEQINEDIFSSNDIVDIIDNHLTRKIKQNKAL